MSAEQRWRHATQAAREQLAELGWSQAELSRRAKVAENTVGDFLAGERRPRQATRHALSQALWGDPHELDRLLDPLHAVDVSYRSGSASGSLTELLQADAVERTAAHQAALTQLVAKHLRDLGVRPLLPGQCEPAVDLMAQTPDGRTVLIEVKAAGSSSDAVYGGMGHSCSPTGTSSTTTRRRWSS